MATRPLGANYNLEGVGGAQVRSLNVVEQVHRMADGSSGSVSLDVRGD